MKTYIVVWEMAVEATDPQVAARVAFHLLRHDDSPPTVFAVYEREGSVIAELQYRPTLTVDVETGEAVDPDAPF